MTATAPSSSNDPAGGAAVRRADGGVVGWVKRHPVLLLGLLFVVTAAVVVWHLSNLQSELIESTANQNAQAYSLMLREFRELYTSQVVDAASSSGMTVTHDYKSHDQAIPLPATLSLLLGERIGESGGGVKVSLYSDHPFPWRQGSGGLKDAFAIEAWQRLNQQPDQPVTRIEQVDGRLSLRYATADLMGQSCVRCHNEHADSPKTDWRLGDVRGVLEVSYPLDAAVAQARASLRGSALLVTLLVGLSLIGLVLTVVGLNRSASAERQLNEKMVVTNQHLAMQKQTLGQQNEWLIAAKNEAEAAKDALEQHTGRLDAARKAALNMMQDMEIANDRAQAASVAKGQFLANMSHEIRTPMTAILGFADLLTEEEGFDTAPPDRVDAVRTIQNNGRHLLAIINDILDLSKIEAGKMTIEKIACSPHEIMREVASLLQHRAQDKGLALSIEYPSNGPATITTDPTRFRQILMNLVGNAVKFTEHGSVRLVASMDDGTPDTPQRLRIDVVDTGIGVSQEQIGTLFDPFSQADNSMARRFGGTGLGLTVSQRLAGILGGGIEVKSQVGSGSTFSLTVEVGAVTYAEGGGEPVASAQARVSSTGQPVNAPLNCRVLLAEDGLDNQRLISFVLKKAGAEVTIAENGRVALDAATAQWQAGTPFDVILMDMQMPEMDGYTATQRLRQAGYAGPIIALTAHAMTGDREKCLQAGCDEYTTKPVNRKKLVALIHQHLRSAA